MGIADVYYLDGSKILIQTILENELVSMLKSPNIKHTPTVYWENCYEVDDKYLMSMEGAGFIFERLDSMLKFLRKTAFLKNPLDKQFFFFELIEKDELQLLMSAPPEGFKKKESFRSEEAYQFADGRVLFADKYLRSGEIFMTTEDYDLYKRLMLG